MTRQEASQLTRDELNKHGLQSWGVRLNQNADGHFLGLCSYRDKVIILNAHHIDIHPTPDVINTIKHEVAHALTQGHGHDDVWADKAREIGCDNTLPCSNLSLSPQIIDAIRSGATVEVTFTEQVIRTPKYTITRLQDKCPYCGVVVKPVSEKTVTMSGDTQPDLKFIVLECGHTLCKRIPKGTPFHNFQFGGDKDCLHTFEKNMCVKCGRFRPYQFQIEGMQFGEAALAVNNGVGFFDEMGLGKTWQAGAIVYFHPEICIPCLWVVKATLKYQTNKFILDLMGDAGHIPQIINSSKDWLIPGMKHYIIGYDMLVPKTRTMKKSGKTVQQGFDITQFDRVGIKCVILDECQQIKNADSTRTQMVRKICQTNNRKVIALSGTPWKNKGSELYPVLNLLDYVRFNSAEDFKRRWVETYWSGRYQKEGGINPRRLAQFKEHVKDIVIRRERKEVLADLPEVTRTKLYVKMTPDQEKVYDEAVDEFVTWYQEQAASISGMHILAMMSKMRHLIALAKIPATVEYIDEFIEDTDRKIVIFAHHIDVQEMLYQEFTDRYSKETEDNPAIPVFHLPGGMNAYKRNEIQEAFNKSPRAILVASQLSSQEGLNLQTCADCVMHERQWNPGNEEQAEGRFIRIGQQSDTVNAVYTQAEGLSAIDSTLDSIVERKRLQFHNAMNKGEAQKWNEEELVRELADAIVAGHNRKKRNGVN